MSQNRRNRASMNKVNPRLTAIQHALNGQVTKRLPADPPTHVASPWWAVTLSDKYGTDGFVTTGNVLKTMREQCKLPDSAKVELRFLSVRAWEIGGNALGLYVCDLIDSDKDYLVRLEDQPGRNHWSRAGYVWPKAHQQRVFAVNAPEDTAPVCYVNTASTQSTSVELYLNVLWRFQGTPLPRSGTAIRVKDLCDLQNTD